MQATVQANMQDYDQKMNNIIEDLTEMIASMIGQIKFSKPTPENNHSPKAHHPTTMVPANNRGPPWEG